MVILNDGDVRHNDDDDDEDIDGDGHGLEEDRSSLYLKWNCKALLTRSTTHSQCPRTFSRRLDVDPDKNNNNDDDGDDNDNDDDNT